MNHLYPIIAFTIIFTILLVGLLDPNQQPSSAMVAKKLPEFSVVSLNPDKAPLSDKTITQHAYSIINVFASWCATCLAEHERITELSVNHQLPVFGIAWKDKPQDTRTWLEKHGNPYTQVGMDNRGAAVIALGVRGTPETFLVGPGGVILYHHMGMLNEGDIEQFILPKVR